MSFEKRVLLFALVETLDTELCRAKLLAPLSLEVVANNWIQAKRLLEQGLRKHIRRRAPSLWAKTRPMDLPEQRKIKVTLKPAKNDFLWTEPIEVCVDMFSWSISGTNRQWMCPALDSVLVTNDIEVSDTFLELQIRNMLARKYDQLVLRDILSLFGNRQFRVQEFMQLDSESVEQYYVHNKKGLKKNKLATVRLVATRVATWQHLPVFEQTANIAKLSELMLNSNPQSVLLVGPRGVGKTAIVYQLACSLADRVWATSGARLVSGMCGLGMWQQRCHRVIREAHDAQLMLHLGSLVELIESGKINGQPGVASLMRGAIDRGQLLAIAECTPEQLSVVQREDPLLLRCFTQIEISPTDETTTLAILQQIAQLLSTDQITIMQDAIQELYRLHQRFSTYSAMPGQPISLLRSMIDECPVGATISKIDVSQRFSKDTGLPTFLLDDSVSLDIEQIRTTLSSNVIGQPEPIEHIVRLITMLKARLNRTDRPLASLLLIGPTGVGKTETAKALARLLYRDHARMIRIDMSEYSQPWSALRLIGAPNEGDGTLTSPIRDQPFSVVLLDEFEKCHSTVLDLLLQVLGEGRLTDSLGNIADFRNAVIILTSNLGVESFHGRSFGFGSSETAAYEHFLREVRRHVRPELLGRIDQIVPYRALPLEVVRQITDRELAEVSKRSGIRYHPLQWDVDTDARDLIAQMGYDPRYGARPLRREIERQIVIPLADCLNTQPNQSNPKVTFQVSEPSRLSPDGHPTVVANIVNIPHVGKLLESNKQRDMGFVDLIRDLRYRADLLVQSPPYHALENNVERIERQISQLQKSMRQLTLNRRQKKASYQIKTLRQQLGTLQKKVDCIKDLASQSYQLHEQSMIDWYAQELDVSSELQTTAALLGRNLKQQLIELHGQTESKKEMQCILVLCQPIWAAKPLWQAYQRICELNGWRVLPYRLSPYNPLLDSNSAQFLQRQSVSRQKIVIRDEDSPSFRLLATIDSNTLEKAKEADVFRINTWKDLDTLEASTVGIAFQIDQGPVSSWLGEEHGVHHFVVSSPQGNKRHRARVIIHPGRLLDWDPPTGWKDIPSLSARDPRRTFNSQDGRLSSHLVSHDMTISEADPIADWVEMIQLEGDLQLWRSIGYSPIPYGATLNSPLYYNDGMPF